MAAPRSFARVHDSAFVLFTEKWPTEIKLIASNSCRNLLQENSVRKIELGLFVTKMSKADQQKLTRLLVNYSPHRFTRWLELVLEQYLHRLPELTSQWLSETTFANKIQQKYGMRIVAIINNLDGDNTPLGPGQAYPIKFIIAKE